MDMKKNESVGFVEVSTEELYGVEGGKFISFLKWVIAGWLAHRHGS